MPVCRGPREKRATPKKDFGMKISQGRDSWSHLSPFPSTTVPNYIITTPLGKQHGQCGPSLKIVQKDGGIWMACSNHTICVCIPGRTDRDSYYQDEANGGHIHENSCGYWFILVSHCFTLRCIPPGNSYSPNVGLYSEQKKIYCSTLPAFWNIFPFIPIGNASDFHWGMLCSLAFEAMVHFKAIPLRVNGWDHMGLRWFRMANPAESVISSLRHQFGVWNRAPGEPDRLGESWQEQRVLGSTHTHLDKTRISQSASNKWSKVWKKE